MVKAIVAIEDYRFYDHGALDLKGTLRAFVTNQANGGSVQGGSSITQQMVKQTLLYQAETDEERKAATEETYARKIRELRYAIAFEKNHSKDWILERYLNIAYFGDGAFGVQSAARHFFSKNAKRPQPARVGDARRPREEPRRLRPGRQPRARRGPTQRRPRPDGPARHPDREEGRAAQGHAPGEDARDRERRPTAASSRGRRSSATTSSTGCSRTRCSATRPRSVAAR